jgi:hypothetical protein
MGVRVILELDGDVVTLPDPAGGASNAACDFDRLLPFASALPLRNRIDEHGDVEFSSSELDSVRDEGFQPVGPGARRCGTARLDEACRTRVSWQSADGVSASLANVTVAGSALHM